LYLPISVVSLVQLFLFGMPVAAAAATAAAYDEADDAITQPWQKEQWKQRGGLVC
jgi:hypothetical protein